MNRKFIFCVILLSLLASACSAPSYEGASLDGKAAILDEVNTALTRQDCATAIASIEGLYNSIYTDDQVRIARASAHSCNAGVSLFSLLADLASNNLIGPEFWISMAKIFYSSNLNLLDTRITSSGYATDSLMAVLKTGTVISSINQIYPTSNNPGSLLYTDRTDESNTYLMFVAMSAIGALENRYGLPSKTNYHKTQALGATAGNATGWGVATSVGQDACAFSAAVLNFYDSATAAAAYAPSSIRSSLNSLTAALGPALSSACNAGCKGGANVINGENINFPSGCALASGLCSGTSAAPCPRALRNRNSCTGVATDQNTCAAAGLAHYISNSALLGWAGPP